MSDHDDNESIQFSESYEPRQLMPLPTIKVNRKIFQIGNANPSFFVNASINVLSFNKLTSKFIVNEKFQQYLMEDTRNSNSIIVSVVGSKRTGKSFLVDSLVTLQTGKTSRAMSKCSENIINSHPYRLGSDNSNNLIFFDCNGNVTNDTFLWVYFMSSVVVYNLEIGGRGNDEYNQFKQLLSYVRLHLDNDGESLPLPQLVFVLRDFQSQDNALSKDFLREVRSFGLFQQKISVFNLPYPGSQNVAEKEIIDVPIKQLKREFIEEVHELLKTLKQAKQKVVKGNYINSKILSLALEAVTNSINKDKHINPTKVWEDITENLSIEFYNYYLECYQRELNSEFQSEKPVEKYALFKKLSGIRRGLDKKLENFQSLSEDPIFSKYRQRLNYVIKEKQKLISSVNKQKSRQANERYCRQLFTELNNDNCHKLIQSFLSSELSDQKSEVLLENFENILEHRAKSQSKKKPGKENGIENEIKNTQQQISNINRKLKQRDEATRKFNLEAKTARLNEKTQSLISLNQKYSEEKQKLNSTNEVLNKEYSKLGEQKEKTSQLIAKDEEEMKLLRQQKDQQMKNVTKDLEQRHKTELEKLKELEDRLRDAQKVKTATPPPPAKDKGCCCLLM